VRCSALQCVAVSCSECVVLCVGAPLPVSRRACVCVCVCARACICRYMFVRGYWRSGNQGHDESTETHCNTLQHTTTHYNTLQHTATHCNKTLQDTRHQRQCESCTLQHTATHCNTLQHTATHCNSRTHRQGETLTQDD